MTNEQMVERVMEEVRKAYEQGLSDGYGNDPVQFHDGDAYDDDTRPRIEAIVREGRGGLRPKTAHSQTTSAYQLGSSGPASATRKEPTP